MKKYLLMVLLGLGFAASAQVKFSPGLRAGANFSKFTSGGGTDWMLDAGDRNFSKLEYITDFYVGFQANIRFTKRYALQPEISYSRQGSRGTILHHDSWYDNPYPSYLNQVDLKVGYFSTVVINKIYIHDKLHFMAGPSVDIQMDNRNFDEDSPIDFGIVAGFGSDLTKNFGIEARIKKGFLPVLDNGDIYGTNLVFSLGATFSFF